MRHLLVTNDFPPKVGGIQSYLWELWRRLPPDDVCVLTTNQDGADAWDREQEFRIERYPTRWMTPTPRLVRRVNRLAADHRAEVVIIDPVAPLGLAGGSLPHGFDLPMAAVIHGAEVTVPARNPLSRRSMRACIRNADYVISAGGYPLAEAERSIGRAIDAVMVPPGVDRRRFRPLSDDEAASTRRRWGLPERGPVVLGLSRLVPRKGFDVLIDAVARLHADHRDVTLAIAGTGRDEQRLRRRAERAGVGVHFLGRIPDDEMSALFGAADIFAMLCRDRWFGWEQEGFGIVFLEAAAAGTPQVAGRSGGSHEAVVDGQTGRVVNDPSDVAEVAAVLGELLSDPETRSAMAVAGRRRVEEEFDLDVLAARLGAGLLERRRARIDT